MSNYIIIGTGGHGRTVLSYLVRSGVSKTQVVFIDLFEKKQDSFAGCPVIGGLKDGFDSPFDTAGYIVAYGGNPHTGNEERETASVSLEKKLDDGNSFVSVIDPSAIIIEDAKVAMNTSIGIGATIGTNSKIQKGVIVNNRALIEHDTEIGAYSNISPGAMVMGGAQLGMRVFLGAGSIIRDDISIGADSLIGMGAVVTEDVPDKSLVLGFPGRISKRL
ncbi:MAG: NeuD/PglB/VioB family sugar acetyltransferase [Candidatus Thorarchaeota archaeon]